MPEFIPYLPLWALVVAGLTYLAREAEVFDKPRGWFLARALASIESRQGASPVQEKGPRIAYRPLSRLLARMLMCAPCTSAWMAPLAGGIVWVPVCLLSESWAMIWVGIILLPISAVGLMWIVSALSPAQWRGDKDGKG